MNILHLTLKKQWFDLILSGEKKEEYRELKPYWVTRIFKADFGALELSQASDYMNETFRHVYVLGTKCATPKIDTIRFINGYSKNAPTFDIECTGIRIGEGNPYWGAPPEDVFILSLGKIDHVLTRPKETHPQKPKDNTTTQTGPSHKEGQKEKGCL